MRNNEDLYVVLWPCSLAVPVLAGWINGFNVQELPKAQPAVALLLKRLRRRGHSLKSHPTDWEKPGIEPATACLQDGYGGLVGLLTFMV